MKLIVGLGNPGREYAMSRHNIGFRCINHFAKESGIDLSRKKAKAMTGSGVVDGQKVLVSKPQTFMNVSGESVVMLLQQNGLDPKDMVVVYDDMDLPLGKVRIRPGGGAGGHRGMESIIRLTGTQDFPRIRVGIGRPGNGGESRQGGIDYVLGRFYPDEEKLVEEAIARASQALRVFVVHGLNRAMNEFNKEAEADNAISETPNRKSEIGHSKPKDTEA